MWMKHQASQADGIINFNQNASLNRGSNDLLLDCLSTRKKVTWTRSQQQNVDFIQYLCNIIVEHMISHLFRFYAAYGEQVVRWWKLSRTQKVWKENERRKKIEYFLPIFLPSEFIIVGPRATFECRVIYTLESAIIKHLSTWAAYEMRDKSRMNSRKNIERTKVRFSLEIS